MSLAGAEAAVQPPECELGRTGTAAARTGARALFGRLLATVLDMYGVWSSLWRFLSAHRRHGIIRADGGPAVKQLRAEKLDPPVRHDAGCKHSFLTEVLSEDAVLLMSSFLPGGDLMVLSAAATSFYERAKSSTALWSSLCRSLLGETLVKLHQVAWDAESWPVEADFWRQLFRTAYGGTDLAYANEVTYRLTAAPPSQCGDTSGWDARAAEDVVEDIDYLLSASGHSAVALGNHVIVIGGWRPEYSKESLAVTIVDVPNARVFEPSLSSGSVIPDWRLRHSSCIVNSCASRSSSLITREEDEEELAVSRASSSILVLGGWNDRHDKPCDGLQTLLLMDFPKLDCSEISWRKEMASGSAPMSLWHHTCGAFEQGRKVIVFGGDMMRDDPEFWLIEEERRRSASHVYILDLAAKVWERVQTTGSLPGWRSLHVGVSYSSLADNSERFVIMGGTLDRCRIFGGGVPANMTGYSLNLTTMEWQSGQSEDGSAFEPTPRMRFAAERYGRHLLVFGGHGVRQIRSSEAFMQLNLMTLEWRVIRVRGNATSHPAAPASALAGGCVVGGVGISMLGGVRPVPKFDVVCLRPPPGLADATSSSNLPPS